MYNHAPVGYKCPICLGIAGIESDDTMLKKGDLVYKDDLVSVFLNSFWIDTVEGHVIVVPNEHYENVYDVPTAVGHRIFDVAQKMSLVIKESYGCDGITLRQNNEPAGDQHAYHYHLHVFPRYEGDSFNTNMTKKSTLSDPKDRLEYVHNLQRSLSTHP